MRIEERVDISEGLFKDSNNSKNCKEGNDCV